MFSFKVLCGVSQIKYSLPDVPLVVWETSKRKSETKNARIGHHHDETRIRQCPMDDVKDRPLREQGRLWLRSWTIWVFMTLRAVVVV